MQVMQTTFSLNIFGVQQDRLAGCRTGEAHDWRDSFDYRGAWYLCKSSMLHRSLLGRGSHTFVRLTGPASQQASWSFLLTHPIRRTASFSPGSIASTAGTIPARTKPPVATRPPPPLQLQKRLDRRSAPRSTSGAAAPPGSGSFSAGRRSPQGGGKGRGRQGPPRGGAAAPRGPAPPLAVPPQPQEPSPGLQTMGPSPAGELGTRSAHPDAPAAKA